MYEYLAYTCATSGNLAQALSVEEVDDELLDSAGDIIEALIHVGYRRACSRPRGFVWLASTLHKRRACTERSIPVRQLDELVWQDLSTVLWEPEIVAEALLRAEADSGFPQEHQAPRTTLQQRIASVES